MKKRIMKNNEKIKNRLKNNEKLLNIVKKIK